MATEVLVVLQWLDLTDKTLPVNQKPNSLFNMCNYHFQVCNASCPPGLPQNRFEILQHDILDLAHPSVPLNHAQKKIQGPQLQMVPIEKRK